jgi:hypothetical protein
MLSMTIHSTNPVSSRFSQVGDVSFSQAVIPNPARVSNKTKPDAAIAQIAVSQTEPFFNRQYGNLTPSNRIR